jgi:hypothetical protein
MGGLAGVRRPIIRTTGDVTGGGGRSVMPTRRRRIGQRGGLQRFYGPPEREVPAGGWAPPPPGGGYSGGVVPRFQTGRTVNPRAGGAAARRRNRPMESTRDRNARLLSLLTDEEKAMIDENIAAAQAQGRSIPPGGWSDYPYPRPPGGGYSGGVIPRFQQGRALTPRAVKRAWGMNRPHDPNVSRRSMSLAGQARSAAQILAGQIPHFGPESGGSWGAPPPGGWQAGGRTGTPRAALKAWGYSRPGNPNALTRSTTDEGRRRMYELMRAGVAPGFGGRGWQEGGQLEDPLFPVESELADESPWYPDEEVGFEEAAPMQGGFDIFGRAGG